jgi:hypothetical protein
MLVSKEPNLHSPLVGCYKIALHFGSAETQYPMRRILIDRGGVSIYCAAMKRFALLLSTTLLTQKMAGGRKYCKYSSFTIYGLAVTV